MSTKHFSPKRLHVLCVIGLLFSLPLTLFATLMRPMPVEEMRDKAQIVLHGTVLSKTVQRESDGQIMTRIEINVIETLKGKALPSNYTIVQAGGVLGDEVTTVSGQEDYQIGEEIIAFLVLNEKGEGITLGLAQGKFQVFNDPATKEKLVRNIFHGRGQEKNTLKRLSLAELKNKVKGVHP
ncbi:MAG TPA: hypothetical protein VMZ27_02300 [Candidatus Saccharimonadales bacterium]|nr:hypothetical protein [Candidatus Saccharimonadales bacterium]